MKKGSLRPLMAALLAAGLAGAAHADIGRPEFRFSGFGTLGVVHDSNRGADFTGNGFQPNGAGYTRRTTINPDTKLGAQVDAILNPQWSGVLQVVSQDGYDNSFRPVIEWANVKYQPIPGLALRAGRVALPVFLQSDTRMVGYAQPWVRPPEEVYGLMPITKNDGLDVLFRHDFGSIENTVQAYYGSTVARTATVKAKADPVWGLNDSVQVGDLLVRAGYNHNNVSFDMPQWDQFLSAIKAFDVLPAPIGPQADALAAKYSSHDMKIRIMTLGATYDPGKWFATGEYARMRGGSFFGGARAWYLTGGYRFGAFTPYATYASTRSDRLPPEPGLPLPAAAPLNAVLAYISTIHTDQSTWSLGTRWDFHKNAALKLQYDRISLGSGSSGRFINVQPGFAGSRVNVFTAALDFVF